METGDVENPQPPQWVLCPVSLEVMRDPVTVDAKCQHTFSRSALVEWLQKRGNRTCPLCAMQLRSLDISPSPQLRDAIQERMGLDPLTVTSDPSETKDQSSSMPRAQSNSEETNAEHITDPTEPQDNSAEEMDENRNGSSCLACCCFGILLVLVLLVIPWVLGQIRNALETKRSKQYHPPTNNLPPPHPPSVPLSTSIDFLPWTTILTITIDPESPQANALAWVLKHPEFGEGMPMWRKQQLMGLSTYYYAQTSGSILWGGKRWLDSSAPECDWWQEGTYSYLDESRGMPNCTAEGKYQVLSQPDEATTGNIPPELGLVTSLKQVWLPNKYLTNTLPTELGLLTLLTDFWIPFNDLSGMIPSELAQLTMLKHLNLGHNNLTGGIPSQLCDSAESLESIVVDCDLVECSCSQCSCW